VISSVCGWTTAVAVPVRPVLSVAVSVISKKLASP
jgi:hypothetical protein